MLDLVVDFGRAWGFKATGVSPTVKQPMPFPEVDDLDMLSGDMSIPELARVVHQLQAQ